MCRLLPGISWDIPPGYHLPNGLLPTRCRYLPWRHMESAEGFEPPMTGLQPAALNRLAMHSVLIQTSGFVLLQSKWGGICDLPPVSHEPIHAVSRHEVSWLTPLSVQLSVCIPQQVSGHDSWPVFRLTVDCGESIHIEHLTTHIVRYALVLEMILEHSLCTELIRSLDRRCSTVSDGGLSPPPKYLS